MSLGSRVSVSRLTLSVLVLAWTLLAFGAAAETRVLARRPYAADLTGLAVSFLARDLATGMNHVLEGSDLDARHTPWSTFKIPNLLMALETGTATSLDARREWDPVRRPAARHWPEAWKTGQTLGEAFARSTVWYFQDVARDIGGRVYRERLATWRYGNASVPDGSDRFWLDGTLRISVREQVAFLDNALSGRLAVAPRNVDALLTASRDGDGLQATLHGKTGTGPVEPGRLNGAFSGWYVGIVRRPDRAPVVFALHVSAPSFARLRTFRRAFAVRLLEDAGLAPVGVFRRP